MILAGSLLLVVSAVLLAWDLVAIDPRPRRWWGRLRSRPVRLRGRSSTTTRTSAHLTVAGSAAIAETDDTLSAHGSVGGTARETDTARPFTAQVGGPELAQLARRLRETERKLNDETKAREQLGELASETEELARSAEERARQAERLIAAELEASRLRSWREWTGMVLLLAGATLVALGGLA